MTAPKKAWNVVVASTTDDKRYEFNRDIEVQPKLMTKTSREYFYELITKLRYPLMKIEAIIERRNNVVDFTCKDQESAKNSCDY